MTTPRDRDALIEEVAGAFRPARVDAIGSLAAWHDLDPEGRVEAAARARVSRRLEAALDPRGRSTTVARVLARIERR
jgi:hypothetical protein